jgi:uncharacterized protein (DUF2249 family)
MCCWIANCSRLILLRLKSLSHARVIIYTPHNGFIDGESSPGMREQLVTHTVAKEGEKSMATQAASWKVHAQTVLDVRPELEQGGEPFVRIMEAAANITPGETLVIVAPFEPVPLYAVLEGRGFGHETERVAADEWVVCFSRRV